MLRRIVRILMGIVWTVLAIIAGMFVWAALILNWLMRHL